MYKTDINELRVFQKPPKLVQYTMEAVCLLMSAKPTWAIAKQVLGDTNFLKKLQEYDKDNIPDIMLKKLKPYIDNPDFTPDIVASQSKVCRVRAIDTYAHVFRIVEPKRKKQQAAEMELEEVMAILTEKRHQLATVEKYLGDLQSQFEASVKEREETEYGIELTGLRLIRAGKLTMALGDEQIRWELGVEEFDKELNNMVGDVLLAAAYVAHLGAFTNNYREELAHMWLSKCNQSNIPTSEIFSLITILADPYEIRTWNTCGLPRDTVSTENAIMVTQAGRWPLMIDPQEQANRWIRQMEVLNQLQIIKLTDSNFLRTLESAIRLGLPVLLEELGGQLDPTLEPILLKQTFIQSGRVMIRLGDNDVEYDAGFKFYMTTKLANPHYLPEICIKVTLVNFTVTPSGLEDQLLADVVRLERPDLEQQRNELIVRINNDKAQLNSIEEKILKLLFFSEGNILDDEVLIETLNESKLDNKGRVKSLTTVLTQEIDRFNKLLKLLHSSIDSLQKAIKGFVVMSESLEEVYTAFSNNMVPKMWAAKAYPSLKSLGGWVNDLILLIDFIQFWFEHGLPVSFWLSGFFFPQGFLTGTLQTHARKYDLPIDQLKFNFEMTPILIYQGEIKRYHEENNSENIELYGDLPIPVDGINTHGLFCDAACWDFKRMILEDQRPGEMNPPLPAMVFIPVVKMPVNDKRYITYKRR